MARKRELSEEEKIDNQIVELLMKKGVGKSAASVSAALNSMYGKVIQRLLDTEFDEFMGYEKGSHEKKEETNRRNGSASKGKKVKTDTGEILIVPPRDREGKFEPEIIKKRQRVLQGFDNIVISMYAKGNTLNDIQETIKEIYSIELSTATLSEMTSAVSEEVTNWQNRPLKKCYPFIYVDCLYCNVKEDLRSIKKAIYVVLGVDTEGKKDVLGIWIETTESATKWCEIFEELKARGVEDIFFVSMDGLTGLPEAVEKVYPQAIMQRCIVHIDRNIYSIIPKKDAKEIMKDFKKIYTEYFMAYISSKAEIQENAIDTETINEEILINGKIDKIIEVLGEYPTNLSNRDYQRFDEKYVKLIFYAIARMLGTVMVKSELEVGGKYSDILLVPMQRPQEWYGILLEFKYIKQEEYDKDNTLLQQKQQEARGQLEIYKQTQEINMIPKLKSYSVVAVKDKLYLEEV